MVRMWRADVDRGVLRNQHGWAHFPIHPCRGRPVPNSWPAPLTLRSRVAGSRAIDGRPWRRRHPTSARRRSLRRQGRQASRHPISSATSARPAIHTAQGTQEDKRWGATSNVAARLARGMRSALEAAPTIAPSPGCLCPWRHHRRTARAGGQRGCGLHQPPARHACGRLHVHQRPALLLLLLLLLLGLLGLLGLLHVQELLLGLIQGCGPRG